MARATTTKDETSVPMFLDAIELEAEPKTTRPDHEVARVQGEVDRARARHTPAPAIYGQIVSVMGELENITPDKKGPEKLGGYAYISPGLFTLHLRKQASPMLSY